MISLLPKNEAKQTEYFKENDEQKNHYEDTHLSVKPPSSKAGQRRLRAEAFQTDNIVLLSNALQEFRASDLQKIVDLPYAQDEGHSLHIHGENSKQEKVGIAYFLPKEGGDLEHVAWFWNSETGFKVISSKSEIFKKYPEINTKIFGFNTLRINESGIVACSFSFGVCDPTSWCWWSKENGLHTAPLLNKYFLLQNITENGNVLLSNGNEIVTTNINNMNETRSFEYPLHEIKLAVRNFLIEYCKQKSIENLAELTGIVNSPANKDLGVSMGCQNFRCSCLLEDGSIQGRAGGSWLLAYNRNPIYKKWPNMPVYLEIHFTLKGDQATVEVKERIR